MGFQSGSSNKNIIDLKSSDLEKITKTIISALSPLIGSTGGKTVYIQGTDGKIVEEMNEVSMNKLASSMIMQISNKTTNFSELGKTQEVKKDVKETQKTLDLLKDLE